MSVVLASLPGPAIASPQALIVPPAEPGGSSKLMIYPFFPLLSLVQLLNRPFHRPFGHHHFGLLPFRDAGLADPSLAGNNDQKTPAEIDKAVNSLGMSPFGPIYTSYITPTGQVISAGQLRPVFSNDFLPYPVSNYLSAAGPSYSTSDDNSQNKASPGPLFSYQQPQSVNLIATSAGTFVGPPLTSGNGVVHFGPAAAPTPAPDPSTAAPCDCPSPETGSTSPAPPSTQQSEIQTTTPSLERNKTQTYHTIEISPDREITVTDSLETAKKESDDVAFMTSRIELDHSLPIANGSEIKKHEIGSNEDAPLDVHPLASPPTVSDFAYTKAPTQDETPERQPEKEQSPEK